MNRREEYLTAKLDHLENRVGILESVISQCLLYQSTKLVRYGSVDGEFLHAVFENALKESAESDKAGHGIIEKFADLA